jgi:hypothetical protein
MRAPASDPNASLPRPTREPHPTHVVKSMAMIDAGAAEAGAPIGPPPAPPPHLAVPQIISGGGPVLKDPVVVPVTWNIDPDRANAEQFAAGMGATAYWSAIASEYGIGPLRSGPVVHLSTPPPAMTTQDDIGKFVSAQFDTKAAGWPAPTPNMIVTLFYPQGTRIQEENGQFSCEGGSFGWHDDAPLAAGGRITYAVVPKCLTDENTGHSGFDVIASTAAHEWIEAATDPLPTSNVGLAVLDPDHLAFGQIFNTEVADLCTFDPTSVIRVPGLDFAVQRSWSNAAARAGHDPCVPAPAGAYFFAEATLSSTVTFTDVDGNSAPTKGISVPVGRDVTVDVLLVADGTVSDWEVSAVDEKEFLSGTPQLSFTFDRTTGNAGDHLQMTIHRIANGDRGGTSFTLVSTLGDRKNFWAGYAAN